MEPLLEIIKRYGLAAGLIAYLIFRDYLNYKEDVKLKGSLAKRLENLEVYEKTILQDLVEKSTKALAQSTRTTRALIHALRRRPCLTKDMEVLEEDGLQNDDNTQE